MGKKKVKLAWIENHASRRTTFIKRKKGLLKKVSELGTLCEVDACAIIYGPYDAQPDVWPNLAEARRVHNLFMSMTYLDESKNLNHGNYLRQRIDKVKEQYKQTSKENRELEITELIHHTFMGKGLHDVEVDELSDMAWLMQQKMKKIIERIDELKVANMVVSPPQQILKDKRISPDNILGIMDPIHPTIPFFGGDYLQIRYGDYAPQRSPFFT